jgi:hypothetical protein
MIGPTKRQTEVLRLVALHVRDHGFPPTLRELGAVMGITFQGAGVRDHLRALERKGLIARDALHRSRGITLLSAAESYLDGLRIRPAGVADAATVLRPVRCIRCHTESFAPGRPCFGCYSALTERKGKGKHETESTSEMIVFLRLQEQKANGHLLPCRAYGCGAAAMLSSDTARLLPFCRRHLEVLPLEMFDELVRRATESLYDPDAAISTGQLVLDAQKLLAEHDQTIDLDTHDSVPPPAFVEPERLPDPNAVRWVAFDKNSPEERRTIVLSETWVVARELGAVALGLLVEQVDAKVEPA